MLKTYTAVTVKSLKKFVHCGQTYQNLMCYPQFVIKTGARFYPQALLKFCTGLCEYKYYRVTRLVFP
ncbi:hypothetical protein SAMN03080599_00372 [Acidaminobacter hydrogenoformans DSM 2784]|uniref:Uncharacterized protein n=1 Tax=Acidaminobacter hydrogenoformans DSM 2784 TaxID=1120920 RepID=A0A1G5RRQ1_9FIRM|nr:hypothetical protein SAMN03080599_00372 [Acidaminobacter hydrogenoformans DSM 2784]